MTRFLIFMIVLGLWAGMGPAQARPDDEDPYEAYRLRQMERNKQDAIERDRLYEQQRRDDAAYWQRQNDKREEESWRRDVESRLPPQKGILTQILEGLQPASGKNEEVEYDEDGDQ